jgi:hypothetical protein
MKYKKILASIVIIITVFFLFAPISLADSVDIRKIVRDEKRFFV